MKPLTLAQYEKNGFRKKMRFLSYPEKVRCVVELQKRIAPIMALRGIAVKPWTI